MKQYESYKDSGIEWLGKIPSHWNTVHIKNYFNVISGATPDSSNDKYWDGDIIWITPADFKTSDHFVSTGKRNLTAEGYKSCGTTMVPAGSLIFSKRAPIGTVAISSNALCTNQGCLSCVPFEKVCFSPYYYYLFSVLTEAFEMLGSGSTFLEISAANFSNFPISAPSFEEQQSIAAYLDYKVGQIDAVIAEKEQMLEDLKAYRSAMISEAVTKGLNKDVEMKDSGIDWIGEIPENWNTIKLSRVYPNIGSGTTPDTNNSQYYSEEGINWLQTGDLNDGDIYETSKHITELALKEKGLRIYPKGSLVIAMYGATIGKVGLLQIETTTNQACCVLPPNEKMSIIYTKFVLQAAKDVLLKQSVGGGQPNISQSIIRSLSIPMPPLEEQIKNAEKIQNTYQNIEKTLNELLLGIDDLKAYKSSIITEAVTGKVDLRDWKPKLVNP